MVVEFCLVAALALAVASVAGGADGDAAHAQRPAAPYGPDMYSVKDVNAYQPYGPRYYEQYGQEPHRFSSHDNFDPYEEYYSTQLEKTLVEDSTPRAVAEFLPSCPDCIYGVDNRIGNEKQSAELAADAIRLEAIKLQILTKLGLKSKPEIKKTMPRDVVMETLYRAGEGEMIEELTNDGSSTQGDHQGFYHSGSGDGTVDYDDFYGRTSEIITFAEPGPTLNGQRLVEFPLPRDEPRPGGGGLGGSLRVRSAYLWLKADFRSSLPRRLRIKAADRNLTLWIFRVATNATRLSEKGFEEAAELVGSTSARMGALGWLRVDVTEAARRWAAAAAAAPLRLLADCSGCGELVRLRAGGGDEARPFLAVRAEAGGARRVRRRAFDCAGAPRGHCCKQRFYVSFRALGWDDWIIAPRGYFANYCRGACGARSPDAFPSYHAHVIEEARRLDRLAGLQPCCAPVKFSAMSLIYFGPDSNIIKRDLPKMVVDECGCP